MLAGLLAPLVLFMSLLPRNGHKVCTWGTYKFTSKESVTFIHKTFIPIVCHRHI